MSVLGQLRLLLARNLREGFRTPVLAYCVPVVIPLALLFLVAETHGRVTDLPAFPTRIYAEWLTPAIVMLTAMTDVGYAAASLVIDIQSGFIDRLRLLDVRPPALFSSRMLFDVVRVLPAGAAVLVLGVLLGTELDSSVLKIVGLFGLLALWAAAYGGLYFVVALTTKSAQAPVALAPLFLPLMFLSTQFCPRSDLPGWAQTASRWNPFSYMVDASRALTTGPYSGLVVLRAVDVAVLLLVATLAVSFRAFSRAVDEG
jgi:ABC-2 type transport system permease protein